MADNVDNFLGSDFYGTIANDANILSDNIQKYMLATSYFAKGVKPDINNYLTKDRINNVSSRQKPDPVKNNILWRKNPLELVFKDLSTFDAEYPIAGSLLRELDVGKKLTVCNLVKKTPGQPGVDFTIRNK